MQRRPGRPGPSLQPQSLRRPLIECLRWPNCSQAERLVNVWPGRRALAAARGCEACRTAVSRVRLSEGALV